MARNKDFFVNSTPKRDRSFFVKEVAKPNINAADVRKVNIADFNLMAGDTGKKVRLDSEINNLETQIQQKEADYVRANNISDWNKKNQTKSELQQELNALRQNLDTSKQARESLDKGISKGTIMTPEQLSEHYDNMTIPQKIDKAIKWDIPQTAEKVGRTGMDLIGNVATGITKGMEGYVDAAVGVGGTALSGIANLAGKKEAAQNIKNKAEEIAGYGFSRGMEDLVDEKSQQGAEIYKPSILGIDVRDAAQEIARMYSVGVTGGLPGFMVSATGGNIEEALNEGESLGRATAYGAISGSLEGIVEKMFDPAKILGGGLKTIGKGFLGKIAEATVGEGAEEGITAALNPFIKMLTYKGETENPFGSWENFKNYLKDIGQSVYQGAVIGGLTLGVSAPGNVDLQKSFSNDVYNAVEKIQGIDQVQKNEIANTILEGAKSVTGQDIKNIREYVDVYKRNSQNTQRMSQNLTKNTDLSIQRENVTGLPKVNALNATQNVPSQQTNTTLPTKVEMAQKANTEQINATPNLPTQKAQKTYQSAKIAGMTDVDMKKAIDLNNMLRSGANLEFYDEKTIPQNVQADKAKIANGFYKDGTLWINKNSKNKVEQILGHELTHHLESTNSYTDLSNTILDSDVFYDYISEKGYTNVAEYKTKLKEMGYTDAQMNNEMVARFVEEKLFTDQNSIDRLARQNTKLVEKIKNWISDLVVSFKGTSQEKELRRIENMYRKALDQARNTTTSTETQYSIAGTKAMENINDSELTNAYNRAMQMSQNNVDNETIRKNTGWFQDRNGDWKFEFTDKDMKIKDDIQIIRDRTYNLDYLLEHDVLFTAYPQLRNCKVEFTKLRDGVDGNYVSLTNTIQIDPDKVSSKADAEGIIIHELQHVIQKIEGFERGASAKKSKLAYYTSLGEIEAADTRRRLELERKGKLDRREVAPESSKANPKHEGLDNYLSKRTEKDIEKDNKFLERKAKKGIKNFFDLGGGTNEEYMGVQNNELSAYSTEQISGMAGDVRRLAGKEPAFSMPETDNQGRTLSKEQQEFFKDSKVRDEEGRLIEVYHRTNQDFTEFDRNKIGFATDDGFWGSGFYFSNLDHEHYGKNVIKGYLNITNPLVMRDFKTIQQIADYLDIVERNFNYEPDGLIRPSYNQIAQFTSHVIDKGHDGVVVDHGDGLYEYVIFEPNQIKNVDNTNPTENPDIRYSVNPVEVAKNTPKSQESSLLNEIAPIDDKKLESVEEKETTASILTKSPKRPAKDLLKQSVDVVMRKLVDAGNTINTVGKLTGDKHLYEYFNNTKQARQSAEYMIGEAQTDIKGNRVGNSLIRIFEEVRSKGEAYTNEFFEYLLHMHNIDRMAQNKPVFGGSVKAEDSQRIANELLEKHPEFEKQANKVYAYNRNLMQWRVDSGLISKEQADLMNEMYPHYVPTFRDVSGTSGSRAMQGTVQIANTVRKATGSNKNIMPIDASMARQTMQTVQAAKRNLLGNRLLNDALNNKDKVGEYIQAVEKTTDKADLETDLDTPKDTNLTDNNNVFKIFRNGETYVMQVNNGIYEGLKSISNEIDNTDAKLWLKPVKAANTAFKQLITGYSPMFTIRNFARDIQDAGLYSKDLRSFLKKYPKAYQEMIGNGKMWQLYKSLGGTGSSFFDYETGIEKTLDTKNKTSTKIKDATLGKVEELNMMIEQAPRFAEFMATIEKAGNQNYDTLMEAMLNAADITVNFGRSGTVVKEWNSTFAPFLNPSIQGFDKYARTVLESKDGKKAAKLILRASLLGILPSVLNELLYSDDDEYENLTDRDKDTNFLIKTGDNKWIKIPKGRVLSIFGNTATRALRTAKGEEWDFGEYAKNQASQTAPISVFDSNLYSPIQAVQNNKTWYGSDIVPQRLQDYAPKDQYDENTDAFSKWLGGKINYSPKKINYLIDAYTGVIGDVVLPLTTPKAETNPFTKAFVLDGVTSNEISNDFYNMLDKYNPKQNPKKSAKEVSRYLNKQSSQVSDIYKQIREVENSDISDDEKRKQVRELRELANTIELTAMATAPEYEKAVEKYRGTFADEDVDSDYAYLFANRDIFGAEYAVKTFSKSLYNNHKNENMDKFFRSYFTKQYFQKKLEPEKTKTTAKNTLPTLKQQRAKLPTLKK